MKRDKGKKKGLTRLEIVRRSRLMKAHRAMTALHDLKVFRGIATVESVTDAANLENARRTLERLYAPYSAKVRRR